MKMINTKSAFVLTAGLLALASLGCNSNKNSESGGPDNDGTNQSIEKSTSVLPEFGSYNGDTINVYGPFVLFYGSDQGAEVIDKTSQNAHDIYSDTRNRIIDSLNQKSSIVSVYTTVNCIRVFDAEGKSMIIMRNTFPEPTGVVLSDWRRSPAIKKGTLTEADYHSTIQKYFLRPS